VPDAILLDISMDDLDGWETAVQIRSRGSDSVPIIVVSANVFENQASRLKAAGCQAFVGKPVLESELMDALQRHLGLEWVRDLTSCRRCILAAGSRRSRWCVARGGPRRLAPPGQAGPRHGLHRLLDRVTAEDPTLAASCDRLRGLCEPVRLRVALPDHLTEGVDA
jgi:chemotaxis response regulator CheB